MIRLNRRVRHMWKAALFLLRTGRDCSAILSRGHRRIRRCA